MRTIAVARIIMPKSMVRLSAGREDMSEEMQALCFLAGANSIFYGAKLLTTANPDARPRHARCSTSSAWCRCASHAVISMDIGAISAGPNPPYDVNAIIEIPHGGEPVKYEIDKESGALFVDRFLHTAMFYPGNYGFIPHTLADDGDPCDSWWSADAGGARRGHPLRGRSAR